MFLSPPCTPLVVGVTGHRPDKLGGWDARHPIVVSVKTALRLALASHAPSSLVTGMALGVDQWAAEEAIQLGISFTAAVPCDDFDGTWPALSRLSYSKLLAQARDVVIVSPGPYKPWKLQRRNEWVVDHCQKLLAVHDGSPGGTWNCLAYAAQVHRDVDRLSW